MNFYDSWYFLVNHKIYEHPISNTSYFPYDGLDIHVAKINPETREVSDIEEENTEVEVWLESGPIWKNEPDNYWSCSHDIDLDVGAATFESAIIELAQLVKEKYGE